MMICTQRMAIDERKEIIWETPPNCDLSIFDETFITPLTISGSNLSSSNHYNLSGPSSKYFPFQRFSAWLCYNYNRHPAVPPECFCHTTVEVKCCLDQGDNDAVAEQTAKESSAVADMLTWERDQRLALEQQKPSEIQTSSSCIHLSETRLLKLHYYFNKPPLCSPLIYQYPSIRIMFGVKSAALNYRRRAAIRQTWLLDLAAANRRTDRHVCHVFVVGDTHGTRVAAVAGALQLEQDTHGDLLLADRLPGVGDSYDNLPNKSVSFIHWAAQVAQLLFIFIKINFLKTYCLLLKIKISVTPLNPKRLIKPVGPSLWSLTTTCMCLCLGCCWSWRLRPQLATTAARCLSGASTTASGPSARRRT